MRSGLCLIVKTPVSEVPVTGGGDMDVQIRQAVLKDYPGIARVARDVHEHHVAAVPGVFRSVEIAFSEVRFVELVTDENSAVLVADRDGEIVGYAVFVLRHAARDIFVPRTFG